MNSLNKEKTTQIFNILKDGRFLSLNSPIKQDVYLFNYCEEYQTKLQEFYSFIGIELVVKNRYCYFSSMQSKEKKLSTIFKLIDYISFLYEYNQAFGVGVRFLLSDIEHKVQDDITLKNHIDKIKELSGDTLYNKIQDMILKLVKFGLIAREDEYTQQYIVLDSFDYILEFFNKIEVKEI